MLIIIRQSVQDFLKISFIYLIIRILLDFMRDKDAFNFQSSLSTNLANALLFGILFAAIRSLLAWAKEGKKK